MSLKDKELDDLIERLHLSIAAGQTHMFIVRANDILPNGNQRIELIHFLALLRLDVETHIIFEEPKNDNPVLKELLKVGNLVWMSRPGGNMYFQDVTFENEAAKTEYAEILEKVFKPVTDYKRVSDLDLSKTKNPREN